MLMLRAGGGVVMLRAGGAVVMLTGGGGVGSSSVSLYTGSLTLGVAATGAGAVMFPVVMVTLAAAAAEASDSSTTKVNVSPTTQSPGEDSLPGFLRAAQSFYPSEPGQFIAPVQILTSYVLTPLTRTV